MTAGERNAYIFLTEHVRNYGIDSALVALQETLRELKYKEEPGRATIAMAIGKLETIRAILK